MTVIDDGWTRRRVLGTSLSVGAFSFAAMHAWGDAHAQGRAGAAGGPLKFPSPLDEAALRRRWEAAGVRDDADGDKRLGLAVRYRTDPERIRPFLAPPLEPDPLGEVQINFFIILNAPGRSNVFMVGPLYGECDVHVGCVYRGHRAMTSLPWVLDQDFGRYAGREGVTLRKKDGLIYLDVIDGVMHAACVRRGKTMLRISAPMGKDPAHPYFWFRETGWGEMRYDYRLNVDWRKDVFDDGPVELWQHFGADEGYPTDMPPAEIWDRCPRALDPKTIKLDIGDPSGLDPYAELPVLEILGGSASLGPALFPAVPVPRGPNKIPGRRQRTESNERVNLGPVDKAPMERLAWVHKGFDPPIFRGKVMIPSGWPRKGSAIAAPPEAIAAYKAREAIEIGPGPRLELTLALDPKLHARTVPDAFEPGPTAQLKILAGRVDISDNSTVPYDEAWLLSACEVEGEPAWLALSHIVSMGGDVLNGREVWGYPSKFGELSYKSTRARVTVHGERIHRTFLHIDAPLAGRPIADGRTALTVIGAQIQPKDRQPRFKWVANPWSIEMSKTVELAPSAISLSLPSEPGPDLVGQTDPWFEFAGARIVSARAGRGVLRLLPARLLGPIEASSMKYTTDRGDGYRAPPNKSESTFLIRSGSA